MASGMRLQPLCQILGCRSASSQASRLGLSRLTSCRQIATSRHSRQGQQAQSPSSQPASERDPSHPYLYYHPQPTPAPGQLALSFLPSPPIKNSRTVLGYLPLQAAGLSDFKENHAFSEILHSSIKEALAHKLAESVEFEAAGRPGDGYIHITDERAVPPAGRIGETEDLIGTVFVQDNKIMPETYERLPSYRLITSNGPLILPKGLDKHLIRTLERIDQDEKKGQSG